MALNENNPDAKWILLNSFIKYTIVIFLCVIVIAIFYFATFFGPRKVDKQAIKVVHEITGVEREHLRKSKKFEREYEKMLPRHGEPISDDALRMLERSIQEQNKYIMKVGEADLTAAKRLNNIERKLHDHRAKVLLDESRRLESEGLRLKQDDKLAEAKEYYLKAHELQVEINNEYELSKAYSISRIAQLERYLDEIEALPIYNRSVESEDKAKEAVQQKNWHLVREFYKEALMLQKQVNDAYPNLRVSDITRLRRLEKELASYDSIDLFIDIEKLVKEAEALEQVGSNVEASNYYHKAHRQQIELNKKYPESYFASDEHVQRLSLLRETSLSRDVAEFILGDIKKMNNLLREQNVPALKDLLPGLYEKADKFQGNHPHSKLVDVDLLVQLKYLQFIIDEIVNIQDYIYSRVILIPGVDEWGMLNTEVPQSLYELVMSDNPSQDRGSRLPVDAVSLANIKEFCERISWVTDREVRLPNINEYYYALGPAESIQLTEMTWSAENSNNVIHDVGTMYANIYGFYDLIGNVEEWILAQDGTYQVAGGSVLNTLTELAEIPIMDIKKDSRSATRGFRFVIKNEYKQ